MHLLSVVAAYRVNYKSTKSFHAHMNWHTYLPSSRADSCSILIDLWWHVRHRIVECNSNMREAPLIL